VPCLQSSGTGGAAGVPWVGEGEGANGAGDMAEGRCWYCWCWNKVAERAWRAYEAERVSWRRERQSFSFGRRGSPSTPRARSSQLTRRCYRLRAGSLRSCARVQRASPLHALPAKRLEPLARRSAHGGFRAPISSYCARSLHALSLSRLSAVDYGCAREHPLPPPQWCRSSSLLAPQLSAPLSDGQGERGIG